VAVILLFVVVLPLLHRFDVINGAGACRPPLHAVRTADGMDCV
jgi:hypothetical protein